MRPILRQVEQYATRVGATNDEAERLIKQMGDSHYHHEYPVPQQHHQSLVDEVWKLSGADQVPNEGRALMMGGGSGAGKDHLRNHLGGLKEYLDIDPDAFKEAMARRGLVPKIPGLSPMEASTFVHATSVRLAEQLAHRAYKEHKNVNWNTTMSNVGMLSDRLRELRQGGYTEVNGLLADTDPKTARSRVDSRHEQAENDYLQGKGLGGRWVPRHITDMYAGPSYRPESGRLSNAGDVFDDFAHHFDNSASYDTTGPVPKLVTSTGKGIGVPPTPVGGQPVEPALSGMK